MPQVPQHPGAQAPQQGLGVPPQGANPNPYYQPNVALQAAYEKTVQAANTQAMNVEAVQAQAQADKIRAETEILNSLTPAMPPQQSQVKPGLGLI